MQDLALGPETQTCALPVVVVIPAYEMHMVRLVCHMQADTAPMGFASSITIMMLVHPERNLAIQA